MRKFYSGWELEWYLKSRTLGGLLRNNVKKAFLAEAFYLGFVLAMPLLAFGNAVRDRRIRLLLLTTGVLALGLIGETWLIPHYIAPFTAILYAIVLQCMRHLRVWRPGGRWSGLFLSRAIPAICVLLVGLRLYAQPLGITLAGETFSAKAWFGTEPRGLARARVLSQLKANTGPQLAIVRYSSTHDPVIEWVYNSADIDRSQVVWAQDMGTLKNRELVRYFKNRTAWLIEPDFNPPRVSRYCVGQESGATATDRLESPRPSHQLDKQKENNHD